MKKHRLQDKPGFSLMEILAVLFIVSVALTGIMSLIVQNIQVQSINKDNIIASSLAQEGIEMIRQVRDANWNLGQSFDAGLADGSYKIDYRMSLPQSIVSPSDTRLYLKDGFYINQSGADSGLTPTIFNRQIIIQHLPGYPGAPLQVRSLVSWIDHNHPYKYELRTLLFDWK
jgi:prepilin-type N-terminal cleavage/methylation domain-containing protein